MTATLSLRYKLILSTVLILGAALIFLALPARAAGRGALPSFADLAAKVAPSVVNIRTVKTLKSPPGGKMPVPFGPRGMDPYEFFRRFFGSPGGPGGPMPHPGPFKQRALGSGVIVSPDGYILTNNHVVADADKIMVKLKDGQEVEAELKGRDPKTDLALIKLKKKGHWPAIALGDSDRLRVGDWVLAIGNPFGLEHTVTAGIVSAKGRIIGAGPYDNFIQTDASINPGNSGGPLINLKGELVGINTAIVPQGQGIGFAIPVNLAKSIMEQLRKNGRVIRGWLGVYIQPLSPELAAKFKVSADKGALVADVIKNGPAQKAGIERGDVIVAYDGHKVESAHDLPRLVAQTPVGREVKVKLLRQGRELTLTVKIGELKPEAAASTPGRADILADWGLQVQELNPDLARQLGVKAQKGLVVTGVAPGSAAAQAGLQRGDVILEADRHPVTAPAQLEAALAKLKKDQGLLLLIKRGQNSLFMVLKK